MHIRAIIFLQNTQTYGYNNMIIMQKKSPVTGENNTMAIDATTEQFELWKNGMLIQDAMPGATTDQREFLISGCTPTCWENLDNPNSFGLLEG